MLAHKIQYIKCRDQNSKKEFFEMSILKSLGQKRVLFKRMKTAIVIDANVPLYYAGAMHEERFLEDLKGIHFIPWVVLGELAASAWVAERDVKVKEKGSIEEIEELEKHLSQLSNRERTLRKSRSERISLAYPFVQKKIDQGKWKTIGSVRDLEPYLKGLGKRVEEKVGESDAKIIACCFLLGERFRKVVLLTRDKRLGKIAKEFGIEVESALGSLTKKKKKKKKNSRT